MSVYVSGVWLLVAGPIAGVLLARVTGGFTWQRAALLAAICQLALVTGYLITQSIPVRRYGRAPTPTEVRLLKAGLAAALVAIAAAIAAASAVAWHRISGA